MIIDTFMFFNEKELLELRLRYLNSIVDRFVIVEANITHQGKEKHIELCSLFGGDFFKKGEKRKKVDKSFFPGDLLKLLNDNEKFYFG